MFQLEGEVTVPRAREGPGCRVCWGRDGPSSVPPRGFPVRIGEKFTPLFGEQARDPESGSVGRPPPPLHALPVPAPTTPPRAGSARPQGCGARLTQQRPQVLQAGQHVLLGVQHLLGGLLHIPMAPPGEHPAAGSPVPPRGQEAPVPRESQHRVRPGACRVGHLAAPLRAAAVAASAVTPGRRGGPPGHREGRGRKAVSTRDRRPRPAGGASRPSGAAHVRVAGTPRRAPLGAPRVTKKLLAPGSRCTTSPGMHRDRALQLDWSDFGTMGVSGPALSAFSLPNPPWAASPPGKCSFMQEARRCDRPSSLGCWAVAFRLQPRDAQGCLPFTLWAHRSFRYCIVNHRNISVRKVSGLLKCKPF